MLSLCTACQFGITPGVHRAEHTLLYTQPELVTSPRDVQPQVQAGFGATPAVAKL
jgi:hypothetical protein